MTDAVTSLLLASTPVTLQHPVNAAETSGHCERGGLGSGVSSVLQLAKNKREINSESHMIMKICKLIKYVPC